MATRYFAPSDIGTSGSGLVKESPIYGIGDLSMVNAGDTIVLLPGSFYEQFIVPQNDLIIVSEGATFDSTFSLAGSNTINTSYSEVSVSAWQIVDAGLNVWKKGLHTVKLVVKDGEFLEPMPTSNPANSAATILGAIAENEWTLRTETLDGIGYAIYLRLPAGENPNTANIRCTSPRRYGSTNVQSGAFFASQKTGLILEGQFNSFGVNPQIGTVSGFCFDRCVGVDGRNAKLFSKYDYFPTYVVAGDDVEISADADHCYNAIQVSAANHSDGTQYTGGDIELFDCQTNYCGWLPYYTGLVFAWSDADGGVAIGQKGGTLNSATVRDGTYRNIGPSVRANKEGWGLAASTIGRGWGVIAGTTDTMSIGKIAIKNNKVLGGNGGTFVVGSTGITKLKTVIDGNFAYNVKAPAFAQAPSFFAQCIYVDEGNAAHPASVIEITNNTMRDCTVSNSVIQARRYNAGSSLLIENNLSQANTLETGFTAYGQYRVVDSIATARTITNNISDGPVSGVFGRIGATNYATKALFDAAAGGLNIEGTVTIDTETSEAIAGTANPIWTGVKYWSNARPNGINGEPRSDRYLDVGAWQSLSHEFHPTNM